MGITKTNTVISDYYQPHFTNNSVKIPLNFLQGKNVHLAKMAPRKEKGERVRRWSRDRLLRWGVAVKDLKGPDKHNVVLGLSI